MRVLILAKIIVTTARHPLQSSGMSAQPASPKLLIDELPVLQASGLLRSNVRARNMHELGIPNILVLFSANSVGSELIALVLLCDKPNTVRLVQFELQGVVLMAPNKS